MNIKSSVIVIRPESVAYHEAYLLGVGKVMGSMLGPSHVIAKDVKKCTAAISDAQH